MQPSRQAMRLPVLVRLPLELLIARVDSKESFYCQLNDCDFEFARSSAFSAYKCKTMSCKCMSERMLCGEDGSLDLTEWFDSPEEGPKGPAIIECSNTNSSAVCSFQEDNMNTLITQLLGDSFISLACNTSSCVHKDSLPQHIPTLPKEGLALNAAFVFILSILGAVLYFFYKRRPAPDLRYNAVGTHPPAFDIIFSNIGVLTTNKITTRPCTILHSISGKAKTGKLMAVLGPSGSGIDYIRLTHDQGKSTLLSILAGRDRLEFTGDIIVNGQAIVGSELKESIGYVLPRRYHSSFVGQSDALLGSLTVFETILFAAMVKLPVSMSTADKYGRVYEILLELDILHIAHSMVGYEGSTSISGGEKRRVSIGVELIRNPSVLILDEPTSGLDAFNAYNVVEALSILASTHNKTIILSIHQPRSNIVSLFDDILLLGKGRMLYSGASTECTEYFESKGFKCPLGYNIADFLSTTPF